MENCDLTTVVLQSHRPDRFSGYLASCGASVSAWARDSGFAYERCDDSLFDRVPGALREKFAAQPVVLADLARLLWMREKLDRGCRRVVWCDADLLVFRPFTLHDVREAFGRECWVQESGGRLRTYRKIHNAFMQFHRDSPVLPFYIDRATALLEAAAAPVVPQFIGPKLLTAWHNIAPFPVEERVGMLSPRSMADLLGDGDAALRELRRGHGETLCALNLSASYEGRESDGVCHRSPDYDRLVDGLLHGALAATLSSP